LKGALKRQYLFTESNVLRRFAMRRSAGASRIARRLDAEERLTISWSTINGV